jgi:hypothetical protein
MNFDVELKKAAQQMHDAEDELTSAGFPIEQWILIRKYITGAILHTQISIAKAWQELPAPEITS